MTAAAFLNPWENYRNLSRRVLVDAAFLIVFTVLMFDQLVNPQPGSFSETVGTAYVFGAIWAAFMKIARAVRALGASTQPRIIVTSVLVAGFYCGNAWFVHQLWAGRW